MGKIIFSTLMKSAKEVVVKRSPEILTGIGIAGMITGTVLAVKATPKAIRLIEEKKEQEDVEKLTVIDTVKTTWTCYIPTVVTSGVSVACLVGASKVNLKRNAALATAYALSETALKDYKDKVIDIVGESKNQKIKDAIAKDKMEKDPVTNHEVIITNNGKTLCYDTISGRYFQSDINELKKAANEINRRMRDEMFISVNDWYYEIGLDSISVGDELGWHIDKGYVELYFSSQLAADDTPCVVINYELPPQYDCRCY
jgi:hypothetical protein